MYIEVVFWGYFRAVFAVISHFSSSFFVIFGKISEKMYFLQKPFRNFSPKCFKNLQSLAYFHSGAYF